MSKTLGRFYLFLAIFLFVGIGSSPCFAKDTKVSQPKAHSPEFIVQQALVAALNPDEQKGFDAYLSLLDVDEKTTQTAVTQIRRYSWKRFRRQAADYIVKDTQSTFIVQRRDPSKVTDATKEMRLFVKPLNQPSRTLATPIRLKRRDGSWFVTSNSL
jgi:hypothetical protein